MVIDKNGKNKYDEFDEVINFKNLYNSAIACKKRLSWKGSIIDFSENALEYIHEILDDMSHPDENGRIYTPDPLFKFYLNERGVEREIQSQTVRDRVIHKCVAVYSLIPYIHSKFVYDNMASQKDKGVKKCKDRTKCHLQKFYREHGTNGYVLRCDVRKFFDSINHEYMMSLLKRYYKDEKLLSIFQAILDSYDKGLGLGSEICQSLALLVLNDLDHIIKEDLGIKYYGRYMDDFRLIHHDKKYLEFCRDVIEYHLATIGMQLHPQKTQLTPLSEGIKFLKSHFYLTNTGKVIVKIDKEFIRREHRKLKKLRKLLDDSKISMEHVRAHYSSVRGNLLYGNNRAERIAMDAFYKETFKPYLNKKNYFDDIKIIQDRAICSILFITYCQ